MPKPKLKKSPSGYYRAKESFVTQFEGEQLSIPAGELVHESHKLLNGREELFVPADSVAARFGIESATAAPGEKR